MNVTSTTFSQTELTRYSRHLLLPEVGLEGQKLLKEARVLVVGAGGLGSPVIQYLAAAGTGTIGIIDDDKVDLSNLQRQVIYRTEDIAIAKVERAAARVKEINPEVKAETHYLRIGQDNVMDIIAQYDLIIDGSDNFSTRYLVNDACVLSKRPNVHGAIYRFEGQLSVFALDEGPCYRCIFPEPPPEEAVPNCAEGGVLGVMAGVIGSLQATEAIKIILSKGTPLSGRLLIYDALESTFRNLVIQKDENCPLCGKNPSILKPIENVIQCGSDEVNQKKNIEPTQLKAELESNNPPVLLDVRSPQEVAICKIEGSKHIPLNELENKIEELNSDTNLVVYCKSGKRSNKAMAQLVSAGFSRVRNLRGGITAWINDVDQNMTSY